MNTEYEFDKDHRCCFGGRFGDDIDELKECNTCNAWVDCAEKYLSKKKWEKQCDEHNPLTYDCKKCSKMDNCGYHYLRRFMMVPHFILDDYLAKLSGAAVKIFLLLNKMANYRPGANHFGRCWLRYDQIAAKAGVGESYVHKPLKELRDLKLIEQKQTTMKSTDGEYACFNEFTVTWYKRLQSIKGKGNHYYGDNS